MKNSRILPLIFGFFILYIGIIILLNIIGIHVHGGGTFSLFIIFLGYLFLKKKKKIVGYIFIVFGCLILLEAWFGISIFDLIGFIISVAFIYYGYRMIRNRKKNEQQYEDKGNNENSNEAEKARSAQSIDLEEDGTYRILTPQKKHTLIGNFSLAGSRWELIDMDIWHGIGEVKVDLSRANIPDNKSTIIINGWIGDVDIFVPYDLDVAIIARVGAGQIEIFGHKENGLNRSTAVETTNYRRAVKRVEIVVNLFVGDIDVNYL